MPHPLFAFYVLAMLIACAVMVVAVALEQRSGGRSAVLGELLSWARERHRPIGIPSIVAFSRRRPLALAILVFAAAPTIAAVVVAAASSGGLGLRALAHRLQPWQHVPV